MERTSASCIRRNDKTRVLFFAEPATLAHVVRPLVLAGALDPRKYEIVVCSGEQHRRLFERAGLRFRSLDTIGTAAFLKAVAAGRPMYPLTVLRRYVADDLRHIRSTDPDIVVGDFRLSLAVSARLAGVPYLAISNAYFSPHTSLRPEVPAHALTRLFGPRTADRIFQSLAPAIFAAHSRPLNRLRAEHGMPTLGPDIRRTFTEADRTLFADVPEMVPTGEHEGSPRYAYLGPVTWSPDLPIPEGLDRSTAPRPLVYLNLGSSGNPSHLGVLVRACAEAGCQVAVGGVPRGSAVHDQLARHPAVVACAGAMPGSAMAARASVVICNGGSPSTHQALEQGTPVLGIPANLDQLLNMQGVVRSGAGITVRADSVSRASVGVAVEHLLRRPAYRRRAARVAQWFLDYRAKERFAGHIGDVARSHRHVRRPRREILPSTSVSSIPRSVREVDNAVDIAPHGFAHQKPGEAGASTPR